MPRSGWIFPSASLRLFMDFCEQVVYNRRKPIGGASHVIGQDRGRGGPQAG